MSVPMRQLLPIVVSLAVAAGCSSEQRLADEHNPFYKRGIRLRSQSRYAEAAEAFERCLRLNPKAPQTHLQLALLYDDHLNDAFRAVLHYRAFLAEQPSSRAAEMARQSLARSEVALMEELAGRHPAYAAPQVSFPVAPEPKADPTPDWRPGGVSERERQLAERIKQLARELAVYRAMPESKRVRIALPSPGVVSEASGRPPLAPTGGTYTVQPGDTLSKLAKQFYGRSSYWTDLRDYNKDVLNGRESLYPGMRLTIPPRQALQPSAAP